MSEGDYSIKEDKRLLLLSAIAFPLFAIVNPVSFFLGYISCFQDTDTDFVYVPSFKTFFMIAFTVFVVITVLKFAFFKLKRRFASKQDDSFTLFFLFHSVSQLPYLILLSIFFNYWGPRDLNEIGFGFFMWYFVVSIGTWLASFCIFNLLTYMYPRDEG